MLAVAHNPEFARKAGVPQSVGQDFEAADEGKTDERDPQAKKRKALANILLGKPAR